MGAAWGLFEGCLGGACLGGILGASRCRGRVRGGVWQGESHYIAVREYRWGGKKSGDSDADESGGLESRRPFSAREPILALARRRRRQYAK